MLWSDPSEGVRTEHIRPALLRCPRDQLGAPPRVIFLPVALDAKADDAPQIVGLADLRAGGSNGCGIIRDGDVNDNPARVGFERMAQRRDANAWPNGFDDLVTVNDRGVGPAGPRDRPDNAAADFVGRAKQYAHVRPPVSRPRRTAHLALLHSAPAPTQATPRSESRDGQHCCIPTRSTRRFSAGRAAH